MSIRAARMTAISILTAAAAVVTLGIGGPALGATTAPSVSTAAHPASGGGGLDGTFYIDDSAGSNCSDAGSGRSAATPWCDFANLDGQTLGAGAHVLLKRGDTFTSELGKLYGTGTPGRPIVLGAYGSGERPMIEGSGRASDRGIWVQDASYWTVEDLQISNVGAGLVFWYSSNGHRGLTVKDVYTSNVRGVFAGSPAQSDLPGMYHSAGILITGSVPVTKGQTAVSDVHFAGLEGYDDNDDLDISGFNATSGGQQGFLSTALGDHSVSDVTVTDSYFHHALSGENFDNLNHLSITGVRIEDTGYGGNGSGTTALFFWSSSTVVVADSILTGEQNTNSPDQTESDLEAFDRDISFLGDYFGDSAGGAVEFLEINGYTDNYQSGHVISDSTFVSNGTTATFDVTPASPSNFSGTASANLYGSSGGEVFSTIGGNTGVPGELPGWTYKDNYPVSVGTVFNAGEDFSATQGTDGWSQLSLTRAGSSRASACAQAGRMNAQWSEMADYDATSQIWGSNGTISATAMQPAHGSGCAVARAWTAPADGTVSLRGRIVAEPTARGAGGSETARITVNGRQVWPAAGGAKVISAKASSGDDANVNLYLHAGDVVRFEVANRTGSGAPVAWMPSVAYTGPAPIKVNDNDPSVSYSAGWTDQGGLAGYYENDAHYSNTAGNTATVAFTGTGIAWYGEKSADHGRADVAVCDANGADCGSATTVDTYAPVAAQQQSLYTATGLAYGAHTLKITLDPGTSGTASYVDIDYFTLLGTELNDADPAIVYSSGWGHHTGLEGYYDSDSHSSSTPGATAQVPFTGSGITWIGSTADRGRAQVAICQPDGGGCSQPVTVSPFDPLSDTQQPLYSIGGLSGGPHVLKITVLPGSQRGAAIDLDAFSIDASPQVDDNDPAVSYSAGWAYTSKAGYYDGDAHYSGTAGSVATVTFTGTGVTWIGGEAADHGRADVAVCDASGTNCAAATTVDTYSPTTLAQQTLYMATGLPYGTHTLKITVRSDSSGSGHYTDIDAFAVSD